MAKPPNYTVEDHGSSGVSNICWKKIKCLEDEQVLFLLLTTFEGGRTSRAIALISTLFQRPYYMCGGFSLEVSGLCIFQLELPKYYVCKYFQRIQSYGMVIVFFFDKSISKFDWILITYVLSLVLLLTNLTNELRLHQFLEPKTTVANMSLKNDAIGAH